LGAQVNAVANALHGAANAQGLYDVPRALFRIAGLTSDPPLLTNYAAGLGVTGHTWTPNGDGIVVAGMFGDFVEGLTGSATVDGSTAFDFLHQIDFSHPVEHHRLEGRRRPRRIADALRAQGRGGCHAAATEAQYAEMWARDATAMYGYAGSSAQATTPDRPVAIELGPNGGNVATVHVLRGRVRLTCEGQSWEGRSGDLLKVPNARHGLQALEDSAILLTVAKLPLANRSHPCQPLARQIPGDSEDLQ
jgi:hypothetical protein